MKLLFLSAMMALAGVGCKNTEADKVVKILRNHGDHAYPIGYKDGWYIVGDWKKREVCRYRYMDGDLYIIPVVPKFKSKYIGVKAE